MTVDPSVVTAFVIHEAELLDAGDLLAWLELYAGDAVYWVPAAPGGGDPEREVSIVYDDRVRLAARVDRLLSGKEYAQDPPSRTCRQLSNLAVRPLPAGEVAVDGVMVVYETRPNTGLQVVPGRVSWRLRPDGEGFVIAEKRIDLLDLDRYHENLTFVL